MKIIHSQFKQFNQLRYSYSQQNNLYNTQKKFNNYVMPHPIWKSEEMQQVDLRNLKPLTGGDRFAYYFIQMLRIGFDYMSGYKSVLPWQNEKMTEKKWLNRVVFLETVAGVPGFVAAMHRHLRSLRGLKRDQGWIHTLLEEAENERMHLLTFLQIKKPSTLFRFGVMVTQMWYVTLFSVGYLFFPRVCHRIVGYLEEEAVKTYTKMIDEIQNPNSSIHHWKTVQAGQMPKEYWQLGNSSTLYDVVLAIRKDEEHHKIVNHKFADDHTQQSKNQHTI